MHSSNVLLERQEALYLLRGSCSQTMPSRAQDSAKEAAEAFQANFLWLMQRRELSQSALAEAVKRHGGSVSQKTVSNIKNLTHRSKLSTFGAIADGLGVPLWVMFMIQREPELLEGARLQRLTDLMHHYLRCSDEQREYVEKMAAGYAGLNPKK